MAATTKVQAHAAAADGPRSPRRSFVGRSARRFARNRLAMAALAVTLILFLFAAVSLVWTPYDPAAQDLVNRLAPPSEDHWLGTDNIGRDVLSRLMVATRIALRSSLQAVGIGLIVGATLGVVAGYRGRAIDAVLSQVNDVLMALPPLLFAVAIVGVLGQGLTNAMIAVGILLIPRFFRIGRAATMEVRHEDYIEAARAAGTRTVPILGRHVLPGIASPMLIMISFSAGVAIVAESGLSFLGLGIQPPMPSWGGMLKEGFDNLRTTSWLILPPAFMLVITVMSFSLIGDGIRDAIGRQVDTDR